MVWETNRGIYLGFPKQDAEAKPSQQALRYVGDRHIVTIGPNGSGKSRRLLLPNIAELTDWSMLIVDPKGELCEMTAEHRRRAGSEIVILDPFGKHSTGFNPIKSLALNDDFPDDALGMAEAVIRIEGKEPHWSQAAQEFLAALIMYVRVVMPETGSFAVVRELLGLDHRGLRSLIRGGHDVDPRQYDLWQRNPDDPDLADYVPPFRYRGKLYPGMIAAGIVHNWEEIGHKAARFGDVTPENREILGVLSTALTQTRWLDSRPIKRDLDGPRCDFSVMKEHPVTVYLILPARRLATHSTWLRLMIGSVLQVLMKDTARAKVPVLLMLDEFFALAEGDGLPIISRNMAMMRGYGIKLWTVLQDLGQAYRLYGDQGFESFIGNAGVLQSFAPQDVITAEYLSKRTGQTTRTAVSASGSVTYGGHQASIQRGSSLAQIPLPLMLPQDLRELADGDSVVFSHKVPGTILSHLPFPTELASCRDIMKLDPAA